MLLVLVALLSGVLFFQQKPHGTQTPAATTTTTTETTTTQATPPTSPTVVPDTLQISSGPTWIPLKTPEKLTLDTSSLSSRKGVAVSLELFSKIQSRSEFHVILKYGVRSLPIASSPPVDLTQLPQDTAGNPQLNFQISESSSQSASSSGRTSTSHIQIPSCSPNCSGVYPLLAVFVKGSQIVGTALTEVALEPSKHASTPLNFALLVQAPFTGDANTDLQALSVLVEAVSANPNADLTLNIPGALLREATSSSSPTVKKTLALLTSWSRKPFHQIITSGFVPLNLPQLASSGLSKFIGEELSAGSAQAENFLNQTFTSLGPIAVSNGLTYQTADTLTKLGVSKVELPAKDFKQFNEKFSLSRPFLISTGTGTTLTALSEDSELHADMTSGALPYRGANELSTDLAQIYFDQPNDANPRVVSTLFQVTDSQNAARLKQTLSDLTNSPFIRTVDLNSAFSLTSNEQLSFGQLTTPAPYAPIDPSQFQSLAGDISSLTSSLGPNTTLVQASYNLMASISPTITSSSSKKYLQLTKSAVHKVSSMISLASNKAFTVTARKVQLPIAISSKLKVPFKGRLVITSDRLSFPKGNSVPVTLKGPNTTLSIPIYAETLGLYLISAQLETTNGQFVVARTSIEIRSTAFSAASILLTLGAFLVLALWWIQSFRRGHQRNKRLVRERN